MALALPAVMFSRRFAMALALPAVMFYAPGVVAEENAATSQNDASNGEAGRHFRRGVALYSEANYTGALVEFKRAYGLERSAAALYDAGEAQYQLQDYAGALMTFRRFLAEYGPSENHRAEVAQAVEVLRSRVGYVTVTTVPSGADVTIDDEALGKTPLLEPLLVSVGRRRLVASMAGRGSVTEAIDVAAGDRVSVSLQLREPGVYGTVTTGATAAGAEVGPVHGLPVLHAAGWIAAGALAAGALTFGAIAVGESHALGRERNAFPAMGRVLNHDANLTATYSILADSFGAAAILVGAACLYWTLSPSMDHAAATTPQSRLTISPASARFEMTF
jgi:tetratricopeptide (TPR) repeat protein